MTIERGPPFTDDAAPLCSEIRARIVCMPQNERFTALCKSIDQGDDVLAGAVLSAPPLLSGLTSGEIELLRSYWSKARHPEVVARIEQLQKDAGYISQAGKLLDHSARGAASTQWLTPLPTSAGGPVPMSRSSSLVDRVRNLTAAINAGLVR